MGLLLATAQPNRRYLLFSAGVRLGICLLALIGLGICIARPAASPDGWLVWIGFWLTAVIALFFWGIAPLRLLTRSFECYENAIVVFDRVLALDQVELFIWRRKPLRLLGFPTDINYLTLCCRMLPEKTGRKHQAVYTYNELVFSELFNRFEEAYEHSLPCEYHLNLPPIKGYRGGFSTKKADDSTS